MPSRARGKRQPAIVAAVVCPPAPLLIPGLANSLAAGASELRAACDRAVSVLRGVEQVLILTVGRGQAAGVTMLPGTLVTAAGLARSDRPVVAGVRLPGGSAEDGDGTAHVQPRSPAGLPRVAVGTAVAAHLLVDGRITAPATSVQLPDGSARPRMGTTRTGLLVMADGAACHGDHAPGAPDPRSDGFDADLVTALRSGDPAQLAGTCRRLAALAPLLRAESLPALATMAALTSGSGPARAELLHYSAPFGVGYPVAVWQWDRS